MSDSDVAGHANGADLTSAKSGGSRGAHGEPVDRRHQHAWVPAGAALLTALIGLSDIIAIFKPDWTHRLNKINYLVPGTLNVGIRSADVIIGLMLLMLAHGLRRRKRRAFQAVTALLAFDIGIHFYHSQFNMERVPTAIIALVLLVALLYFRDEFYAEGDPRTRWRALWVFAGLVVADVAIGLIYILFARGLEANYSFTQRVQEVIYGLVGVSGPVQWVPEARGDLFNVLTGALGFFTLVVTVYLFLRPAEPRARLGLADAGRVRELLGKYGDRDSLGYFALRDDKSVIWSPTGKACVCYRVVSGVMLASGDPIGDPEAWSGAIGPFLDEAARHAWAPAVMGCSELGAEVWCREGNLTALELGDEAVVNVADFSLSGRSMRNVRQMVNRVAKNGYEAEVRRVGDIPPRELDAIMRAADTWRGSQTERGFSMALGRIGGPGDEDCVLATAKENGVDRAVLQLVPWGADGLSLDLMRRDKGAQPGLNDFLIVEAIKAAPGLGVKRISLNFAVFRAALERGERIGAGPVLRAWRSVLIFLSKWFQIESLYKFNAKFGPVWQPRFFVFPSTKDAPRIAVAALEAEAFLVWPRLEMRRIARKLGLGRLRRQLRRVPPRGMGASRARP
ncbi:MAG TPA: phosphatidylglycerol lysyltransferase domain-containing protein [Streptosporangiaceae bacterium]|nr:phosphatidylglycerol lysyltransferase domain-containing protein [Streptosporangiaceae bacterium]